ncbi:Piwi domain-containing protein [Massariosphaeria phaeospora]|uniref:Piwi domain-containing protein n=1 Tax=Massariosphaeria phaeospora TaxID=100035 RepID=A0A7C8M585_9PLEO|nr:Piwi domain-containing protein [Massariosphaeria phaeospora]
MTMMIGVVILQEANIRTLGDAIHEAGRGMSSGTTSITTVETLELIYHHHRKTLSGMNLGAVVVVIVVVILLMTRTTTLNGRDRGSRSRYRHPDEHQSYLDRRASRDHPPAHREERRGSTHRDRPPPYGRYRPHGENGQSQGYERDNRFDQPAVRGAARPYDDLDLAQNPTDRLPNTGNTQFTKHHMDLGTHISPARHEMIVATFLPSAEYTHPVGGGSRIDYICRVEDLVRSIPHHHPPQTIVSKLSQLCLIFPPSGILYHRKLTIDIKITYKDPLSRTSQDLWVVTNFVQIKKTPDRLFVDSISNSYKRQLPNGTEADANFSRRSELKSLFQAVRGQFLDEFIESKVWATDFRSLWTDEPLFDHSASLERTFAYDTENGRTVNPLTVQIKLVKELSDLTQYTGPQNTVQHVSEKLTALNAIVSRPVNELITSEITQVAVRGYYSSVRPGKDGTLLNINTATGVFFPPCGVSDFLYGLKTLASEISISDVERWLKGVSLRVSYVRPQLKGREGDINSEGSRRKTFKNFGESLATQRFYRQGDTSANGTTVLQYYTQELGISNLNPTGRCVNVGKKLDPLHTAKQQSANGAIWIPAQLLEIEPNQPMKSQLCPQHTSHLITHAKRNPNMNLGLIDGEGMDTLQIRNHGCWQNLSLEIDTKLIDIPASLLAAPALQYQRSHNNRLVPYRVTPQRASWNFRQNVAFLQAGTISALNLFSLDHRTRSDELCKNMVSRLSFHGMIVTQGHVETGSIDGLDKFWTNRAKGDRTTFVVIESKGPDNHAKIKRKADLTHGVRTVCAVGDNIPYYRHRNNHQDAGYQVQHLDNIAMKFNSKSGGSNHNLSSTSLDLLREYRDVTIILGADVTHPGVGSPFGYPSVACVVGSDDKQFQNYPGSMRLQAGGQEEIEEMEGMVLERLEAWYIRNHQQFPRAMLFYRDGISESMFDNCKRIEIRAVRNAFDTFKERHEQPDAELKLTFVIVSKRHHTRFFPTTSNDRLDNGNLKPGLLVDQIVTSPREYNFYLQSHAALQGTARSAHYSALLDEMGFGSSNNRLAEFTHHLCYCFPRATKGVSYAAPAYIADRMCERGRQYLRPWVPTDEYKTPLDAQGNRLQTKEAIRRWKRDMTSQLARNAQLPSNDNERVWGNYTDMPAPGGQIRLNPWHPNLDNTMFWM